MNEKNDVMFLLDESPKNDPTENITLPTYSIYHFNNPHTNAEWYQNDDPFVKYHIMGHAPIDAQGPGAESLNEATKNYQHFGKKFMRRGLSDRQIARLDNKHNIDQSIFDLAQEDLEIRYNYDKQRYENGEISEQKWRQLENRYNRWSRNLGNNQLSLDQKQNPLNYVQVHKPGDIAPALFSIGFPLITTGALTLAPYTPWILKNIALPIMGGELVNEITRKISGGHYDGFGDWLYRSTPLEDWTKDTWLEEPIKFATDLTNPGYLAPYGKIANGLFHSIPQWVEGKTYGSIGNVVGAQLFRNPSSKAWTAAERLTQMVPPQHQTSFVHGVQKGNQAMASLYKPSVTKNTGQWFTAGEMPNPQPTFFSGTPVNFGKINLKNPVTIIKNWWQTRNQPVRQEVSHMPANDVLNLFNSNNKLQTVDDLYHMARYRRTPNGITIGSPASPLGTLITNPSLIVESPHYEMDNIGIQKFYDFVDKATANGQIVLTGEVFSNPSSNNVPMILTNTGDIKPIIASDAYKSKVVSTMDKWISDISKGSNNGKHLSLPALKSWKNNFINSDFILNQPGMPLGGVSNDTGTLTLEGIGNNSFLKIKLPDDDYLGYQHGRLVNARLKNILDDEIVEVPFPHVKWFKGMSYKPEVKVGALGLSPATMQYRSGLQRNNTTITGNIKDLDNLPIVRNLAFTIDNPQITDLVIPSGEVNLPAYNKLKQRIGEYLGKSPKEINHLFTSLRSSSEGHTTLDNHLLQVARSAQELPLPQGYTRQEAVTAALLHDLGKIIDSSKLHGHSSVDLIDQLGIQITNPKVRNVIKHHMDSPEMNLFGMEGNTNFKGDEIDTNFASFLHLADVARGTSLEDTKFYFPHLFSYNYPKGTVLKGDPAEQMGKLNSLLTNMGYDGIDISLPIKQQWSQLQANMKRMNTFIRGSRAYFDPNDEAAHIRNYQNAQYLAKQRGLNPDNPKDVWTVMQEQIPMEPTGSGRFNLFDFGTKANPYHKIVINTWSDAAAISPEKMDGLYFSVSPETGYTYMTASNPNAYSAQATILRGKLSDYDIRPDESPFEYFERLYPFIHRYQTISDYQKLTNPLSEFNQGVANTLLGRTINNTPKSEAVAILRKHFPHSDFVSIMTAGSGGNKILDIQDVANSLTAIPQSTFDLYEKYGFSKLDAVLNHLIKTRQIKSSVVDLPNYRNNIILNTYGILHKPESGWMGRDFQGIVVAPKGEKVFTVLDEIDVNGFPKSSSGAFRDAGGDNIREGLKINIPFYKNGGICKNYQQSNLNLAKNKIIWK